MGRQATYIDRLSFSFKKPNVFSLVVGDISPYFSKFSLRKSLKGIDLTVHPKLSFRGVLGFDNRRWEELADSADLFRYRRFVSGFKIGKEDGDGSFWVNYFSARDADGSLPNSPAYIKPIDNQVLGLQFSWDNLPFAESTMKFELAKSLYNENTLNTKEAVFGTATNFYTKHTLSPLTFRFNYKKIEPDFFTSGNYTDVDRESYLTSVSLDLFNNTLHPKISHNWYRNNLAQQLSDTSNTSAQKFSLTYLPACLSGNLASEIAYESRKYYTDTNSINRLSRSAILSARYKNPYSKVYLKYMIRRDLDRIIFANNYKWHIFNLGLGFDIPLASWLMFSPNYRLGINEEVIKKTKDQTHNITAVALVDIPWGKLKVKKDYWDINKTMATSNLTKDSWNFNLITNILGDKKRRFVADYNIDKYIYNNPGYDYTVSAFSFQYIVDF